MAFYLITKRTEPSGYHVATGKKAINAACGTLIGESAIEEIGARANEIDHWTGWCEACLRFLRQAENARKKAEASESL